MRRQELPGSVQCRSRFANLGKSSGRRAARWAWCRGWPRVEGKPSQDCFEVLSLLGAHGLSPFDCGRGGRLPGLPPGGWERLTGL